MQKDPASICLKDTVHHHARDPETVYCSVNCSLSAAELARVPVYPNSGEFGYTSKAE